MVTKFLQVVQKEFGHKAKVDQVFNEENYDAVIGVCDATLFELDIPSDLGDPVLKQISPFTKRNFSRRTFKTILVELSKKYQFSVTEVLDSISYVRDYKYKDGRRAEIMILGKKRCVYEVPVYEGEELVRYDYGTQPFLMSKLAEVVEEEIASKVKSE